MLAADRPGGTEYTMYREESTTSPRMACTVGTAVLKSQLRVVADLHAALDDHGYGVALGSADEQNQRNNRFLAL
ncbi:DUF6855 family protein [Arthrobacter alpinus]|uniref:DUF6855 family protein n=2 Tax=Arthrobacter TaxID=1663 RepID=UPI0037BE404A